MIKNLFLKRNLLAERCEEDEVFVLKKERLVGAKSEN